MQFYNDIKTTTVTPGLTGDIAQLLFLIDLRDTVKGTNLPGVDGEQEGID